ncbi:amino acid permease [Natronococcus wangiae]|uniref:amino acid permease n=1 Tax=Natronococcus wangiae TaxID=3068275 RepID=UPI00273D6AC0|nr:amino acid permease [Natronococcus sp. AD5]
MTDGDEELAKDLGPLAALTIGIGTMIGAGIFVLPGPAVLRAGSLVGLAFVIGGLVAMLTAFSVAELGTAMPKSGGMYYYINHSLGPLFGSIAGWGNWLGLAFASAFYMIGFGAYVSVFLPLPTVDVGLVAFDSQQLWGLLGASFFISVNYLGAKETGRLQNAIVLVLLAILGGFTAVGIWNADLSSLTPIEPEWYDELLPVTAIVFVSYLGFGQIASVGEEIKNPGRNLPLAIVGSVLIVTVLYGLLMVVMLAAVNVELVAGNETAAVDAARVMMEPFELSSLGAAVVLFGALLATASSANASILASSRINFAMGRDKIVSAQLNVIHDRFSTPYRAIALTGGLILLFIAIGDVEPLATAGSVLHLIIFALINAGLIVMRVADPPDYDPAFTVPGYPITPILGSVLSITLIWFMSSAIIALSIGFVIFAMVWYLLYARGKATKQGILGQYIENRSSEMPDSAVSAASAARPSGDDDYTVLVPVSNPRTESDLLSLASVFAKANGGRVQAVHIVEVPDQTPLSEGSEHIRRIDAESRELMENVRESTETMDVPVDVKTVVSHRSLEEVFDVARRERADKVVMGWGTDRPWSAGRAERPIDELTHDLPCDFLVLKDRGLETDRVLVPTAGGPDSDLSAEIATHLRDQLGSDVTLLHVVDDPANEAEGETFLTEWAADHGLDDVSIRIDTSGDVEEAIAAAAREHSFVIIGATERGLLSRLVRGSLAYDVINDVECSVLLAERPTSRSLRERLIGTQKAD